MKVKWLLDPEAHDYPAAASYLSLHFLPEQADEMAAMLMVAQRDIRADKDILRASGLPVLPKDDKHVQKVRAKIKAGERLSPVLIVVAGGKTYIADGYHRICAFWHLDYDELIPCRIIWFEA